MQTEKGNALNFDLTFNLDRQIEVITGKYAQLKFHLGF